MGLFDGQTPGTFPGPSGIPMPPGPGAQLTQQDIMKKLAQMLQMSGKVPGGGGGGQPTNLPTAGMVGQVPGGQPPIPFSTAGAPMNVAPPSGMRPQAMQIPMPQDLGSEFGTKAGAVNATVKETIGGLAQFLQNYKNKKQQDESIKAEGYFSQIMAAAQNPNDPNSKMILDVLGSDPKVIKTIEKGMEYTFAKQPGGPPEPEPPESRGLKGAIQKLIGRQQQTPMPQSLPKPGQPGGIMIPGPTLQQQLQASQTNAQLSGMQQSPELRAAVAGTALPPPEMELLDANARVQAGHDYAKYLVELEKSQTEARKSDAAYQRQMLANQGRVDAGTQIARINAAGRVQSAQIMAQASMMRIMGRAPKMPPVNIQNEYSALNRANSLLGLIMGGDKNQETYNQFLAALKAGGKGGVSIMSSVPGQGSTWQKAKSAVESDAESAPKWKTVQSGLDTILGSYKKAMTTAYPEWTPTGGKTAAASVESEEGAAASSIDDEIMNAMDEGDASGTDESDNQ